MATGAKLARLAHYSHEFGDASHIFLKNWLLASVGKSGKSGHGILANLVNLANFKARAFYVQKRNF
jgi:hypothetical protein